jgi:hypothetical protein
MQTPGGEGSAIWLSAISVALSLAALMISERLTRIASGRSHDDHG